MRAFVVALCAIFLSSTAVIAAAPVQTLAYDEEIARLRKELAQIQSERKKVREETARDRKEFDQYRNKTSERMTRIRAETDSIRAEISLHQRRSDSLSALVNSSSFRAKQFDLLQQSFRKRLSAGCDSLLAIAALYPPMTSSGFTSSLTFLRSELASSGIENAEGANRLALLARDMNEANCTVQIMQGVSPLAQIRGTTYRIRIGSFFEAVVDEKATLAAFWRGYDTGGKPRWEVVSDPEIAASVLKSVNVREGKTIPALVELPFFSDSLPGGHP